uniref:Lipoprotein n=1 Tax=Parastrongyloides trichosuri TaxID=131310 RepID=A0A0N4ZLZ5_PARTI
MGHRRPPGDAVRLDQPHRHADRMHRHLASGDQRPDHVVEAPPAQPVAPPLRRPARSARPARANRRAMHRHPPVHPLSLDGTEPRGRPPARPGGACVHRVHTRRSLLRRSFHMKPLFALTALSAAALTLVACGQPAEKSAETAKDAAVAAGVVQVADAWCRPTPNGAKAGGCYLTLTAGSDDRL